MSRKLIINAIKWLSPVISVTVFRFLFPNLWKLYVSPESSISFILDEINSLYRANPSATLMMISSFIGVIFLYYGSLVKSENKLTSFTERIETYMKAIEFFSIIPTFALFIYLFFKLMELKIGNFLILILVAPLLSHQFKLYKRKIMPIINERYDYHNLVKFIQKQTFSLRDMLTRIDILVEKKSWILDLIYATWIFLDLMLIRMDVFGILLIGWLYFVSTTEIALLASLCEANYFLVDIDLSEGGGYNNAIYIREEKKDFIRIVPQPPSDYEGVLVNRNHIISIKFKSSASKVENKEKG